jgi:addiction module RelB/DinJ family antitoxin
MKATETIIRAKVRKTFARKSERIFSKLGITTDEAINMFLAQVIERNGIPFTVVLGGVGDDGNFWSEKIREDSLAEVYGS